MNDEVKCNNINPEYDYSKMTTEEIIAVFNGIMIDKIIKTRQEKGISQKKLEKLNGVKQPVIARIEKGTISPQLHTLLKILRPLGLTIAIATLDKAFEDFTDNQ